ncbi:MAG: hypothetical protein J6S63_12615 [Atopobiaceae bacterium]|nr:hypothetical protein [Atopobiaceae bacterium]
MDIQEVASQLMGFLGNNPDKIAQFAAHPYSTTARATGTDETISKKDMSQILTQVAAQATGKKVEKNQTADVASALLGQNGGSVHSLASALLGGKSGDGVASMAELAAKSAIGGIAARGAASLITGALGMNNKK